MCIRDRVSTQSTGDWKVGSMQAATPAAAAPAQPAAPTEESAAGEASNAPTKRKLEDRELGLDRARVYDIRRRVNAAKLVDKICADSPEYMLPFCDTKDAWRRLVVYYTAPRSERPPEPEDPASGVPQKVQDLEKQFDQLRGDFAISRKKAETKRPPHVAKSKLDKYHTAMLLLRDEKKEAARLNTLWHKEAQQRLAQQPQMHLHQQQGQPIMAHRMMVQPGQHYVSSTQPYVIQNYGHKQ
eukprot:TRINITY_DN8240_c0_g1_i1.p1 TRINITY_DN8240_c0_g1~~TRINITY_DN8240_c0_g1_i1.p1  ORF type:complete len:241 (+),score=63.48 TRINITY_DN8240_c0_g1_i1:192-914(+)